MYKVTVFHKEGMEFNFDNIVSADNDERLLCLYLANNTAHFLNLDLIAAFEIAPAEEVEEEGEDE